MKQKELTQLTDQELLEKAKKMKSRTVINALLIGFMIGIIIFSILKSTVSLFTLVPLFFIFKFVNNGKDDEALKAALEERNLK